MAATSQSLISPAPSSLPRARLVFGPSSDTASRLRSAFPAVLAASTPSFESEEEEPKPKLWGGRFDKGVTDAVEGFTDSISYDRQLYMYDIMGSKAHAHMLAKQGFITTAEMGSILDGLDQIEKQIRDGKFKWRKDTEDVRTHIEAALIEKVGEPAKKLHTARSHADQIVTDLRLWCRDAIDKILIHLKQFQGLIATGDRDIILGGLDQIQKQIQDGKIERRKETEDVRVNIEAALVEKVGEPAKELHTTRSRNDQITTDLRLWCRDAIDKILIRIKQFQDDVSQVRVWWMAQEGAGTMDKKVKSSKSAKIVNLLLFFLVCLLRYAESKGILTPIFARLKLPTWVAIAVRLLIVVGKFLYRSLKEAKEIAGVWGYFKEVVLG